MEGYTIWIDGLAYCGEADDTEPSPPTSGAWWLQRPITTRSRLAIGTGEPHVIDSRRSLASHLDRILSRHREGVLPFREITIRRAL